jgi:phage antirepressor YoqD-like protein
MSKITEDQIVEMSLEDRAKFLGNIRVLDKVKDLILLPNTELMTTRMVANWFEVTEDVVRDNIRRNRNELESNGMKTMKHGEIKDLVNSEMFSQLKISGNGATVFSKRAVLNIAMLLRDSSVAKRVRTALLDQQEHLTDSQKVAEIDEEKKLALDIMFAPTDGEKMLAFNSFNEFKNRHIKQLEETIEKQEPMVDFYQDVGNEEGTVSIISVGKSFGIGEKKFFQFLRSAGVLFTQDGYNIPKQTYQNQGYFKVNMGYFDHGSGSKTTYKTNVTGRGKTYLHKVVKRFGGAEIINGLPLNKIDDYVQQKYKKLMS